MKVLVCIDNNLKMDSRLKRHIKAIAKVVDEVHVLARPNPNHDFGLDIANVTYSFFEIDYSHYSDNEIMKKAMKDLNVYEEIEEICPFINCSDYYAEEIVEAYDEWLSDTMKGGRWQDVLNGTPEQMPLSSAMSYTHIFLLNSVFMAYRASNIKADVILCNDIDTLLCGVVHKKKYGSRLIYDIHDATYDISPGVFPMMYRKMLVKYEYQFSKYPDAVMSVGKHLLRWVKRHYGLKQLCVPMYSCNEEDVLQGVKAKHYSNDTPIRVYFHGAAYAARKLDIMVQALPKVKDIELVFRCDNNEYIQEVKKLAEKIGVKERVHFLEMVPTNEVVIAANKDGDIGIYASIPDGCINWASSFTNKFVEYLGAGLPILTTKAEDQMRIVQKYKCGFILESDSVECMENAFKEIISNRDKLDTMSRNSWKVARTKLNWTSLEQTLVSLILGKNVIKGKLSTLSLMDKHTLREWEKQDLQNAISFDMLVKEKQKEELN